MSFGQMRPKGGCLVMMHYTTQNQKAFQYKHLAAVKHGGLGVILT